MGPPPIVNSRSWWNAYFISQVALEKALHAYPDHEFLWSEAGEITAEYDVILTSNCLEHYSSPFELMASHLGRCRKFHAAMVPFEETPLHDTHAVRFDLHSFPDELRTFTKLSSTVFRPAPRFWHGRQVLVVYASQLYLQDVWD